MIKFLDLKLLNTKHNQRFSQKFDEFLDSGHYILGNEVEVFEKNFAHYCGVRHCVGVGNGLDALTLILKGFIHSGDLNLHDKVLVAANTYIATILAIKRSRLIPVLIEPKEDTYNIDPNLLEFKEKPKAILVTHLYGQLAEMEKIKEFCIKNELLLISDAAQAHGAKDSLGNKAGSLADAAAFSFYPTKNLGALGDGGAVTTDRDELATYIKKVRNYGFSKKNQSELTGVNSRLDEIQAAFLNIKLPYLDEENEQRRKIAKAYLEGIKNSKIIKPYWNFSNNHVFHQFVIKVKNREQFRKFLKNNGIESMVHYPTPPHKQKSLSEYSGKKLKITERLSNEMVSLPINPLLADLEIEKIIEVINSF